MLDDLIRQLQNFDPNIRRSAIIALGKTKNEAALRVLADVVLKDSDPELRELARKAGIYIRRELNVEEEPTAPRRRKTQTGEVPALPIEPSQRKRGIMIMETQEDDRNQKIEAEEPPTSGRGPVRGKNYRVPEAAVKSARAQTETALSEHTAGRKARAMKALTEALSLNPNLINDDYFNNVASQVTGLGAFEAIESIVNPQERNRFITDAKQLEKKRKVDAHMSEVRETNMTDFSFELVLFTVIAAVAPAIIVILVVQTLSGFLNTVVTTNLNNPQLPDLDQAIVDLQTTINGFTIGSLVPFVGFNVVTLVGSFLVQMGLVHLLATALFAGHATFIHLSTTVLKFYNRWLPIVFAVLGFGILIAFFAQFSIIALCPLIILVGLTGFVLFNTAGKIGQAYGFGAPLGCITLVLASMVIALLNVVVTGVVAQASGFAINSLMSLPELQNLIAITPAP